MNILSRLWRYVHTHGYPRSCVGPIADLRPKRSDPRRTPIEPLEPRILLTTLFGGESFQFTDARNNVITVTVTGNTITELVAAVQGDDGNLIFADLSGKVTASTQGRAGTFLGNGVVPVSFDEANGAPENIFGGIFGNLLLPAQANNINVQALATLPDGRTIGFNVYPKGNPNANVPNSAPALPILDIQVVQFSNTTGTGTVVADLTNTLSPQDVAGAGNSIIGTASSVSAITAAAYNPADGLIYFVGKGASISAANVRDNVNVLYAIDPNNLAAAPIIVNGTFGDAGVNANITAIAFDQSAFGESLYAFRTVGNAGQLMQIDFSLGAASSTQDIFAQQNVVAGFGNGAVVNNISGLAFPGDNPLASEQYLYATTTGAGGQLLRINLGTFGDTYPATAFGSLTDRLDTKAPFRGQNIQDLTWNPTLHNPFTDGTGVLVGTDATTDDLVFVNTNLTVAAGDIFAVYVSQSDINSSIAIQGPNIYNGNFGGFNTFINGLKTAVAAPANTGVAYIGYLGSTLDPTAVDPGVFINKYPVTTGELTNSIGVRPGLYTNALNGQPTSTIDAGLIVSRSIEKFTIPAATEFEPLPTIFDNRLGNGYAAIRGLSVSRDGVISAIDADQFDEFAFGTGGDQLFTIDPLTGLPATDLFGDPLTPLTITDNLFNGLSNIQGMAYGSVNLGGAESLFGVYDLGDGNGPTLGIINETTGVFTAIGAAGLGLPTGSIVKALAFSPAPGTVSFAQQGCYIVAQIPGFFGGTSEQVVYEVNTSTGSIAPLTESGQLQDTFGNLLDVKSAMFNNNGTMILQDQLSGRLLDYNVATGTGVAGGNGRESGSGTVNPTVGAIAFDPTTNSMYAVDNATGLAQPIPSANGFFERNSSIFVQLRDYHTTAPHFDAQNFGRFLVDGAVTGRVYYSGSADLFYSGTLLTGDITGSNFGFLTDFSSNFHVEGDLRDLYTLTSVGTNDAAVNPDNVNRYNTQVDITVRGKIGAIRTLGAFDASVTAGNETAIPSISDIDLPQQEVTKWQIGPAAGAVFTFAKGYLVNNGANHPFANEDFTSSQYLGTISSGIPGQPAGIVDVQGILQGEAGGPGPNQVDYYGISLLAGQMISIQAISVLVETDFLTGLTTRTESAGGLNFAILDPDGRMIATDYSDISPLEIQNQYITFTADRPGTYRIAIAIPGNVGFNSPAVNNVASLVGEDEFDYDLHIKGTGLGDMAIGAVVADGNILTDTPTNLTTALTTSSITATKGDIGAVVSTGGLVLTPNPFSVKSVAVPHGNLRDLEGAGLGQIGFGLEALWIEVPNGNIGLMRSTAQSLYASFLNQTVTPIKLDPVGGYIQMIDSAADLAGSYNTNAGIGVIRAATMSLGAGEVNFHVDCDNHLSDGIIDLIDVSGDLGTLQTGGPAFTTGLGGNIRFFHVGGRVYQDLVFAGGETTDPNGGIIHDPGVPVTFTDDSGAKITFTPSLINNPAFGTVDPITGIPAPQFLGGSLTTLTYGIRGSGGVVVIRVDSTTGLTVAVNAGAQGRGGEVTTVTSAGTGTPVVINPLTGIPTLTPPLTGLAPLPNDLIINGTAGARVDILNITGTGFDHITNNTPGDIINVTAGDVGAITSHGNIGVTTGTFGEAILPTALFSGAFPFVDQRIGLTVGNVGSISADKAIGNIISNGVIGTIQPNKDGDDDPNTFEGIVGPILVTGTTPVPNPLLPLAPPTDVSISSVKIGEGLASSGTGSMARSGIYVTGQVASVTGSNADIRGNIVSLSTIGTISLNNGSIIDANIMVVTDLTMSMEITTQIETTDTPDTFETPIYEIKKINISGNGGIIGSFFVGADVGPMTVGTQGFGILNSIIGTLADGVLGGISAGGFGIRGVVFVGGAASKFFDATGNGLPAEISDFSTGVRQSEFTTVDPSTWTLPSALTDINVYISGGGPALDPPDIVGTATGVIESVTAEGSQNLGYINAFIVSNSSFNFANKTDHITVASYVSALQLISGTIKYVTIGGDATDFDMEMAGKVGPVSIGGSVLISPTIPATDTTPEIVPLFPSLIEAKGASGDMTSVTIGKNFNGNIVVQGRLDSITIGQKGNNGPGTGDYNGTVTIRGEHQGAKTALDNFTLFGSILGGYIDITGNVGTINIAHDVSGLTPDLIIHGNLSSLLAGTDPLVDGSLFNSPVIVDGNLASVVITGALAALGGLVVRGDLGKFSLVADNNTAGTNVLNGYVDVLGTIKSFTVTNGNVDGSVIAGTAITSAKITGNLAANGEIGSSLGDVKSLTIGGSLLGSVTAPNGTIGSLSTSLDMGAVSNVNARFITKLNVTGSILSGAQINASQNISSIIVGAAVGNALISAHWLGTLSTKQDELASITTGIDTAATTIKSGGALGGTSAFGNPVSATSVGDFLHGASLSDAATLTLKIGGALMGSVFADRDIKSLSAGSLSNAVVTSGFDITSLTVTGDVANSILQAGIARGSDSIFGTNDLGEQARMADIKTLSVGSLTNSIIAAGGNIGTFKSAGTLTNSTVASGLVLAGLPLVAVLADASPLATAPELAAALTTPTLLRGNFNSAAVGGAGLVSSTLAAGVSPGADGTFGTADDNTSSSTTGGTSSFGKIAATADAGSFILADFATNGAASVAYSVDASPGTILPNNPITGVPLAVISGSQTLTIDGVTFTVNVSGGTGSVSIYDNPATPGVVDTVYITNTDAKPTSVTITKGPGNLSIGRIISADNANIGAFSFNGNLAGDGTPDPDVWIDSSMTSFTLGGMPNDASFSGKIGGDVKTLTLATQGPGRLRIAGNVATMNITSSVGNALYNTLGILNPPADVSQLATNSLGNSFAYVAAPFPGATGSLFPVNLITGVAGGADPVTTAFTNQPADLSALNFGAANTLFGIATINNQSPTNHIGTILSNNDVLHGLAVSSTGNVFAIDSSTGFDQIVEIDPATGAILATSRKTIRDSALQTFTNNILAIAFSGDTLYALVNDRDGNGVLSTPADGVALAKIDLSDPTDSGFVRISNPTAPAQAPVIIGGAPTDVFTALTPAPAANTFYAVRHVGASDELVTLTLAGTGAAATVTLASQGPIKLDAGTTDTNVVGIGTDEFGNLIALNAVGSTREVIGINIGAPATSLRITAPGLINSPLAGFAVGSSGTNFSTYAYTTSATGGAFFQNPGVTPTLGTVNPATGTFTQLLALAQDATGTPLASPVSSLAVDPLDPTSVFVATTDAQLFKYSAANGSFAASLGQVVDAKTADLLDVQHINFDSTGNLVALNGGFNRLILINTTTTVVDGQNFVLASGLTEYGLADANDLTAVTFNPLTSKFDAYSQSYAGFVEFRGTTESALGGIVANTIGTLNILGPNFGGRIEAQGSNAKTSIATVKSAVAGVFKGDIVTAGNIGTVSIAGDFGGAVLADGDISSATITGNVLTSGVLSAGGTLSTAALSGNLAGALFADTTKKLTVNGNTATTSFIDVFHDAGTLAIGGIAGGFVRLGSASTIKVTGLLADTAFFLIARDVASVTLSGGSLLGSAFETGGAITKALSVGGTLSGLISTRRDVKAATFNTIDTGLVSIGGNLPTLTVNGNVTDGLISVGTWIGQDGVYNTADDLIFGGSITKGTVKGVFTDSIISAGVLPRTGVDAFGSGTPIDYRSFAGNPAAVNIQDVDSAEAGGIAPSQIKSLTFSQPVVSSDPADGFASLVTASEGSLNAAGNLSTVKFTGFLSSRVFNNPLNAPFVVKGTDPNAIDPTILLPVATRVSTTEIDVVFSKPLDTSTLNTDTVQVDDGLGTQFLNLSLTYFTQTGSDGSTQGVLRITDAGAFGNTLVATPVRVTLVGGLATPSNPNLVITDHASNRSSLWDFDQNGTTDSPVGNPLSGPFTTIQILTTVAP